MTKLHEAAELGQSIWLDFIDRAFLLSGGLEDLIDAGLRGVTSNPSIFQEAIGQGSEYDDDLASLAAAGKSTYEIYEALAIQDIRQTADQLRPIYDGSDGYDGFVSLEVNPHLAYDTEQTIDEARHLFSAVDRPNVMIKVPATAAGIPAIATLIAEGININVTLMFSLQDYDAVSDAYLRGLERLALNGGDLSRVLSVASFFVSRIDVAIETKLAKLKGAGRRPAEAYSALIEPVAGTIGIANSKMAYTRYLNLFSSERWQRLEARGARTQRLLWGSTSTKNPEYADTLYVDNLMGPNTINTLPISTIDAFCDHGTVSPALTGDLEEARKQLNSLASLGIDLAVVTQQVQDEGVIKFANSFDSLLESIEEKCQSLVMRE